MCHQRNNSKSDHCLNNNYSLIAYYYLQSFHICHRKHGSSVSTAPRVMICLCVIVIHGHYLAKLPFDGSEIYWEVCRGGVVWHIFARNVASETNK
jgi:hypothetical protein